MKAVTKTKIFVGIVTIAVLLVMVVPGLSLIFKDGNIGLNMEMGSESVFDVTDDTTIQSIQTNLDNSYDKNARKVTYDGIVDSLTSDNQTLAEKIHDRAVTKGQAITVTLTDDGGKTVLLDYLDVSTESEVIMLIHMTTSPLATKTIEPNLSLYFDNGDYRADTDTSISIDNGVIEFRISIPESVFIMAQMLGCNTVIDIDINYVKMMTIDVNIDLGNLSGAESDITIENGEEKISIDLSGSENPDEYFGYIEEYLPTGTKVNGIPLDIVVDKTSYSITVVADVGTSSLSQMLTESLEANGGCLVLTTNDPAQTITIPADQAEDIIDLLATLEGVA